MPVTSTDITTTVLGDLLKRLYASWEIEALQNLTYPVLNEVAHVGSANLGGTGFFFPVRSESAEGHAFIDESDNLPTSGATVVNQAEVDPKIHVGVVQLTGLSMAVSSGNAMAFARSFDENVQQTIEAMTAYKEGTLFRDGTGILTRFNGNPGTSGALTVDDTNFLRPGMRVDLLSDTDTSPTDHGEEVIDTVDWPNKTVTFTNAIPTAVADNARIYMAGSQAGGGASVSSKEPEGLETSLLSTGTYLGLSKATVANWATPQITASAFFDEDILLRARTRVTQESGIPLAGIANRFKVLCHPQQVDVLFKLAIPRIRYSGSEMYDLGNDENVSFGRTKFITSYLCPPGTAYLGDWSKHCTLYTPNGQLHIDTEYNGSALKWVSDKDVGVAFAKSYFNFACKRPNAFVRITSLTEPTR